MVFDEATLERFWSKVDRRGQDECWPWFGALIKHGYGQFYTHERKYLAHRISCSLAHPNPNAMPNVLHSCDNPRCCNPGHLRWGTQADNVRDAVERGRVQRGKRDKPNKSHSYKIPFDKLPASTQKLITSTDLSLGLFINPKAPV